LEDISVGDIDSRDFDTKDFGSEDLDEMIVFGDGSAITPDDDKPIPFDDDDISTTVSHAPLNLGGGTTSGMPEVNFNKTEDKPKPAETEVSTERITGVKTFFAKLHAGAIAFLDEQITNWLNDNPGITIKRTNTVTGDVQAKKTEPNIIITVWY
jgi:hypothetical protein